MWLWQGVEMAQLVQRMTRFGTAIFTEMTLLAQEHDAINLGQGAPDNQAPAIVHERAIEAIRDGHNQYAPGIGIPELREAIAHHQQHHYGITLDPATQVQASAGAAEALTASILALCEPGDEVIVFEPYFDVYPAAIELAQGVLVPLRLEAPEFRVDEAKLRSLVTERTKLILVNTPHNPTGHLVTVPELEIIAQVAIEHDLTIITDEVYEHLAFDGREHTPIASLPGMFERTLTISSSGKTFSTTGWKIGWFSGPEHLVKAVGTVKQFLTFANGHPFQYGIAAGLQLPDSEFHAIRDRLWRQRDVLVPALEHAGFEVLAADAGYFVSVDVAPLGYDNSYDFCRELPAKAGVAAIPMIPFYTDASGAESLVRFAFCKRVEVLEEAATRLERAFR